MKLYTIYDSVAKEYGLPYPAKNSEVAKRMFKIVLHSTQNLEVDDYSLYFVGVFDENEGIFIKPCSDKPEFVCSGSEALADFDDVSVEEGDEN